MKLARTYTAIMIVLVAAIAVKVNGVIIHQLANPKNTKAMYATPMGLPISTNTTYSLAKNN